MAKDLPHVVVIGAGFAGLTFCQKFRAPARVTVVDQQNHHLFQPLLYQVATAGLAATTIAAPIRSVLAKKKLIEVIMDQVTAIDLGAKRVALTQRTLDYDYLVIAIGGVTHYFGHHEWARHALGLKTLDDALAIRQRILCSFERAETESDPAARRRLMTIVVVGGGPTGVELAGTCAELTRRVFRRDFRHIDPSQARVVLLEAGPRILPTYPPDLSQRAKEQLQELGVEVWTDAPARHIEAGRVHVDAVVLESENILWGGGIMAPPLTRRLGVKLARDGRIVVEPDLSIPGHPEAFAIGDVVEVMDTRRGQPMPGVAPAAMQMGKHAAKLIAREIHSGPRPPQERPAFQYHDKGVMATIGRSRAVAWIYYKIKLSGFIAWLTWLLVHLVFLIGFRNKVVVLLEWLYAYVTFRRGSRIIYARDMEAGRADRAARQEAEVNVSP